MKVIVKTVWLVPILTILLVLWPNEQTAAGKNCCISKMGSVVCPTQPGLNQTAPSTAAAKASAACAENCCGKTSESCCGKQSGKASCKKCGEACRKSCCGKQCGAGCCEK